MQLRNRTITPAALIAAIAVVLFAAIAVGAVIISDRLEASDRAAWIDQRDACRAGNRRADDTTESRRTQRAFMYAAHLRAMATYRRDGFESDRKAAEKYLGLIRRTHNAHRRDCIAAYRPPRGSSDGDDPRRDDPLSLPRPMKEHP